MVGADVDADGGIDLVVANHTGGAISVPKNDGSGSFSLASTIQDDGGSHKGCLHHIAVSKKSANESVNEFAFRWA
jgi:hypothetical protein